MKLATNQQLVRRKREHGASPPHPLYAFTAWCLHKGTTSSLQP